MPILENTENKAAKIMITTLQETGEEERGREGERREEERGRGRER